MLLKYFDKETPVCFVTFVKPNDYLPYFLLGLLVSDTYVITTYLPIHESVATCANKHALFKH